MLSNITTNNPVSHLSVMENIRGKNVVIVGDASGVGRATALMLAGKGAKIFIAASSKADLDALTAEALPLEGRVEGVIADLCRPESARSFFVKAEQSLGRYDAVVSFLAVDSGREALVDPEVCQNLFLEQAVLRMQSYGKGRIINVGRPKSVESSLIPVTGAMSPRGQSAALRRQARQQGIRVTLIEPAAEGAIAPEDLACCVYNSLIQPFSVDVIFLDGQPSTEVL